MTIKYVDENNWNIWNVARKMKDYLRDSEKRSEREGTMKAIGENQKYIEKRPFISNVLDVIDYIIIIGQDYISSVYVRGKSQKVENEYYYFTLFLNDDQAYSH